MTTFIILITLLAVVLTFYKKKSLDIQKIKEEAAKAPEKIEPTVEKAKAVKATAKTAKTSKKQK